MSRLESTDGAMELTDKSSHDIKGDNREYAFHGAGEEAKEQLAYRRSVGLGGETT